jgi:hypothetical protein
LVRNGFDSFVVHYDPAFRPTWFPVAVPTLFARDGLQLRRDDILIFPEDHSAALQGLRSFNGRKIVFCQNHFYIFHGLSVGQSWRDFGISTVFASSEVIAGFIEANLGWPRIPVVHYAIDHGLFRAGPKKLQVAYMPRKGATEASFIRGLCGSLPAPIGQVNWVAIDGLPEQRVADILRESAIFLSLSHLEGSGCRRSKRWRAAASSWDITADAGASSLTTRMDSGVMGATRSPARRPSAGSSS